MNSTKLHAALSILEKEEWSLFFKYLDDKVKEKSISHQLIQYYFDRRDVDEEDLDSLEKAWKSKFKSFTYKAFTNALSKAYLLVEDFLKYRELDLTELEGDLLLLKSYNRRGAFDLYDKYFRKVMKKVDNLKGSALDKHRIKYEILHNQYYSNHPAKYKFKGDLLQRVVESYLRVIKDQLNFYDIEMYNWGNVQQFDFSDSESIVNDIFVSLGKGNEDEILDLLSTLIKLDVPDSFRSLVEKLKLT